MTAAAKPDAEARLVGGIAAPVLASAAWHAAKALYQVLPAAARAPGATEGAAAAAPSVKTNG